MCTGDIYIHISSCPCTRALLAVQAFRRMWLCVPWRPVLSHFSASNTLEAVDLVGILLRGPRHIDTPRHSFTEESFPLSGDTQRNFIVSVLTTTKSQGWSMHVGVSPMERDKNRVLTETGDCVSFW